MSVRLFHCAGEPGNTKGCPLALHSMAYMASVTPMFIALPTAKPMMVWGRCTLQPKPWRSAS